jgi:hypothetical protein
VKRIATDGPYPGLTLLHRKGTLLAPVDISWRRAAKLVKNGLATLYPFHNRWQGKVDITEKGRSVASELAAKYASAAGISEGRVHETAEHEHIEVAR